MRAWGHDEDDDFINQVTEPMKAKTKSELLGTAGADKLTRSRHSSRSRSRSKSNEKSVRTSKKGWKIEGGKMLNEESHRSFDRAPASDHQQHSQAEMMAMPTAGEVEPVDGQENDELRDLDFDQRKLLNNSSSMNLNQKKSKRSILSGQHLDNDRAAHR